MARNTMQNFHRPAIARHVLVVLLFLFMAGWLPQVALAQSPTPPTEDAAEVRVDGKVLFRVRGVSAYPAADRAAAIEDRIVDVARDKSLPLDAITWTAFEDHYRILAGESVLLRLYDFDAELEAIPLETLAEVIALRIGETTTRYRADRTPRALGRSAIFTAALTGVLVLLVWLLSLGKRALNRVLIRRVNASMASIERKSGAVVHRGHLWALAQGLVQGLWILALLVLAYFYLSSVLGTFPWTRSVALLLLSYVQAPLVSMSRGLVNAIPDLMFLLVLWFVVRYLLRILKSFFAAVGSKRVQLANFDAEWADPTYRLLRVAIVAFAVVVAYPYIPGSDSAAFKGVSLFLGVIVSLGSSSFIANLIAGIALTYRGVFREGDWVEIGDAEGRVEEIRSQVVRLRTRDNEQVTVPSSTILNANVVNLSTPKVGRGIVLRCPVGLGYDVSWRQAERLLLLAAEGVDGLMDEPAPRVMVRELGDYAVVHMLLVQVDDPAKLPAIRSELNRRILDAFHEAGVQIMSPAYESDPETPKIPSD
ncbi:MAG: mechanosensitive ion channel family protein [Xanthomonadales bacterium]|jgi:small-conductance mechanosensitive channel|nr:mechanosensitive ion channel family protein [Xanthomonadales bacterium]